MTTKKSVYADIFDFDNLEKPFKDEILENAYMGEHMNIQPPTPPRKKLTIKEQIFYDYIKARPNYTMLRTCRELHINQQTFILLKQQISKKGWKISGVIAERKMDEDDDNEE